LLFASGFFAGSFFFSVTGLSCFSVTSNGFLSASWLFYRAKDVFFPDKNDHLSIKLKLPVLSMPCGEWYFPGPLV